MAGPTPRSTNSAARREAWRPLAWVLSWFLLNYAAAGWLAVAASAALIVVATVVYGTVIALREGRS